MVGTLSSVLPSGAAHPNCALCAVVLHVRRSPLDQQRRLQQVHCMVGLLPQYLAAALNGCFGVALHACMQLCAACSSASPLAPPGSSGRKPRIRLRCRPSAEGPRPAPGCSWASRRSERLSSQCQAQQADPGSFGCMDPSGVWSNRLLVERANAVESNGFQRTLTIADQHTTGAAFISGKQWHFGDLRLIWPKYD